VGAGRLRTGDIMNQWMVDISGLILAGFYLGARMGW
jgi:hypothetical protein